jgi:hypothetical protein
LLEKAIAMNIITFDEIRHIRDVEQVIKHCGPIKKDKFTIKIYNSYAAKGSLQSQGYFYDGQEQTWSKELFQNEVEGEMNYLSPFIAPENIKITKASNLDINTLYYIIVESSYSYKDILKNYGYIYEAFEFKKAWVKKIRASMLYNEKLIFQMMPGVKVKGVDTVNKREGNRLLYINKKEKEIIEKVNSVGCISRDQLERWFGYNDKGNHISMLVNKKMLKKQDDILLPPAVTINQDILLANEILISFKDSIQWFSRTDYPFVFTFFRNDKSFDITVINKPDDKIMIHSINRSTSERIIAIVPDKDCIKDINIDKSVRYCTINSDIKYYIKNGSSVIEE